MYIIQWPVESSFSVHVLAVFSLHDNVNVSNVIAFHLKKAILTIIISTKKVVLWY